MKQGTPFVYLDPDEYDRIVEHDVEPETWCTHVSGYWVQAVPSVVYELEYRGLMSPEERMSTYVMWYLTENSSDAKI
jgi:hypothetical protein